MARYRAAQTTERSTYQAQRFAKRYIQNDFNATKTVKELYHPKNEETAHVMGSELIRLPKVKLAVAEQLDQAGLTDDVLDRELGYIVKQKRQLSPKLGAIVEANKMKSRLPKDQNIHAHLHLQGITDQNIDSRLEEIQQELLILSRKDTSIE